MSDAEGAGEDEDEDEDEDEEDKVDGESKAPNDGANDDVD